MTIELGATLYFIVLLVIVLMDNPNQQFMCEMDTI